MRAGLYLLFYSSYSSSRSKMVRTYGTPGIFFAELYKRGRDSASAWVDRSNTGCPFKFKLQDHNAMPWVFIGRYHRSVH